MSDFKYEPSKWIPFRDMAAIERVRHIKRADITRHKNPDLNIQVVPDDQVEFIWIMDMFYRIKTASDEGRDLVLILPNPAHTYMKVAMLINRFRVNCSKLHIFIMDEYADEEGNIAPESYPQGFMRATKNYFYYKIDEELRPPESQVVGPTNDNRPGGVEEDGAQGGDPVALYHSPELPSRQLRLLRGHGHGAPQGFYHRTG